jgi:hypothetical protein
MIGNEMGYNTNLIHFWIVCHMSELGISSVLYCIRCVCKIKSKNGHTCMQKEYA